VAGGCNDAGCPSLDSAELYDPVTGTWGLTGALNVDRGEHSATLLPNGKVLVAGGFNRGVVGSAELYDPVAGTWSFTGNLNVARADHTATLLPNGKVLVAGGNTLETELYDP
ncbi:MAG: Kelch repeat-containing protein, partial [Pyrinomonadaceae bacterium]